MPERRHSSDVSAPQASQFFLEIAGLIGLGRLGWAVGNGGVMGLALAALLVAVAGVAWGIFRARGYVPNGGDPVVAVPGPVRLLIELAYFTLGAVGLWITGWTTAAVVLVIGVIVVYAIMHERTLGLLRNTPPQGR